jgi:hypothetical protein
MGLVFAFAAEILDGLRVAFEHEHSLCLADRDF